MKKIAIIGAGPAGIFSTLLLKNWEGEVHLFEQNSEIGKKLKLTGGGRMNISNKVFSDQKFSSRSKNLYKRIFKNPHTKNPERILEKFGMQYFWEKNRAILKSQDAIGEVQRLHQIIQNQTNTEIHLNTRIKNIQRTATGINLMTSKDSKQFDYVIITTGGMYRIKDLGPKEKIYNLPLQLGHSLTEINPSLSPLLFSDPKLKKYAGIAFEGLLYDTMNNKSVQGDILITHFGLSGPATLDFSAIKESDQTTLQFIASITESEFTKAFNAMREGKNPIRKFLKKYIPQRLVNFHLENSEITENFMADISKIKLNKLTQSLFHYPIPKTEPNTYPSSWTTKGGIPLEEIHTQSLESKKQPNIFFAGEILDINGLCGGYNIAFAAISAQIVTEAILKREASL